MDHLDLVDRLVPSPAHTLVIETPKGELVLVDTDRKAKTGDTVLIDNSFIKYRPEMNSVAGVAYCLITFL